MISPVEVTAVPSTEALVLGLSGELDAATLPDCSTRLGFALATTTAQLVVLDLRELRFLSAAGMRCLLAVADGCVERGLQACMTLLPYGIVHRIVTVLGVPEQIPVFATPQQAIGHFRGSSGLDTPPRWAPWVRSRAIDKDVFSSTSTGFVK